MKTEKVILYFIATIVGLLVAAGAFYFFQIAKTPTPKTKVISITSPTPVPLPSISLTLDTPKDEEVVNKKTITVSGQTRSNAVIIILTNGVETITTPSLSGNFSTQISIADGQNIIDVISISGDGETKSVRKTITYSQEDF